MPERDERARKLLYEVADYIEAHPESHDQFSWFYVDPARDVNYGAVRQLSELWDCGTRACIAGWGCLLNGDKVILDAYGNHVEPKEGGNREHVAERARELFDLDDDESDVLFDGDWCPSGELTVSEALRAIADGADPRDVTREWSSD